MTPKLSLRRNYYEFDRYVWLGGWVSFIPYKNISVSGQDYHCHYKDMKIFSIFFLS